MSIGLTLEELVRRFGGEVVGDATYPINNLAPLDLATPQQLAFLANPKYLSQVETTRAGAVLITPNDLAQLGELRSQRNFIVTPNPYAYFARVAQMLIDLAAPKTPAGIHPSASIDATAKVATSAVVGPCVVVEAGAVIGENVRLDAHVTIGRNVTIGDGGHLYPRVTIYHGCKIGPRAIIHAGAVIGSDGFGFAPDFTGEGEARTGSWVKIPQVGTVTIGQDVEIGANTTIDRGAMADTIIGDCVKIDNLVQIAHNCKIGAYTVIAACAGISGSTTIGQHCMLGGAAGVAGHLTLGDHIVITAQSAVTKSLLKPGVYSSTLSASERMGWNKNVALLRNLSRLRDRIKALEAALHDEDRNTQS